MLVGEFYMQSKIKIFLIKTLLENACQKFTPDARTLLAIFGRIDGKVLLPDMLESIKNVRLQRNKTLADCGRDRLMDPSLR